VLLSDIAHRRNFHGEGPLVVYRVTELEIWTLAAGKGSRFNNAMLKLHSIRNGQ